MVDKDRKKVLENEVRRVYDEYQTMHRGLKDTIKARVEEELAKEMDTLKLELSRLLHDYYAKGLSKAAMKRATRKYSNQHEWDKLWDAYTPPAGDTPLTTQHAREVVAGSSPDAFTYYKLQGIPPFEPVTIKNARWMYSMQHGTSIAAWDYEDTETWKRVQMNKALYEAIQDDLVANYLGDKPADPEEETS